MHTFWQTALFEVRYHLRQPAFYLFYVLTVGQGFGYALTVWETGEITHANAPGLFFDVFSTVGVLLTALSALLTGQSLLRDRTYRVGDYLYALPLDERLYFAGKFVGMLGTCLLLGTGVGLGTLALPLWVAGPVGPLPVAAILFAYIVLFIPNLLIVVSLTYALTAFTQRMAGAYIALLVLVVGQVLLQIGEQTAFGNDLLLLFDPFGHVLVRQAMEQQTRADQLLGTLPTPDLLLINRLLWIGLSGGLLVRAADRLTFAHWAARETNHPEKTEILTGVQTNQFIDLQVVTKPNQSFSLQPRLLTLAQLTGRDLWSVVRQPAFVVVSLLLVFAIIGYAVGLGNLTESGQRLLPFTSRMTYIRLPMLSFIGLLLVVFTGELLHRERTSGIWSLIDVLPQHDWLFLLAKYGAMLGVAGLLTGTLLLTGVGLQLANGQTPLDWSLYGRDLLLDGWLRYAQLIALTLFIQVLIPNRLAGQLAASAIFFVLIAFDKNGLGGSWLLLFGSLPHSWHYAELTGYGAAEQLRWGYAILWTLGAAGLLLLAIRLGQRGVIVPVGRVVNRWRASLQPGYVVWLAAVAAGFVVSLAYLRLPAQEARLSQLPDATSAPIAYQFATQTVAVREQAVTIQYRYVHDQNLARLQAAVANAIRQGSVWLGTFPQSELTISEVPLYVPTNSPSANRLDLNERDGWLSDTRTPTDAGLFDLIVTQTLLRHWAGHKSTNNQLISRTLTDYLALRIVQQQRGDDWLTGELARLQQQYRRERGKTNVPEPTLLDDHPPRYVSELRGPLSMTSIGEVWGHERLCRQVGQFVQRAPALESGGYVRDLSNALPDSLTYLTTYLSQRPSFDFRIGQIGQYSDRISVSIQANKYVFDSLGQTQEQLLNDYIPVVLRDKQGRIVHRQLIRANTAGRTDKVDWLPAHPDAVGVEIDPLGTWPERNKRDNRKRLVRG